MNKKMSNQIYDNEKQFIRGYELSSLNHFKLAYRISRCGKTEFFKGYPHKSSCKSRLCPLCSISISRRNSFLIKFAIRRFSNPILYLITLPPFFRLSQALSLFRSALSKLLRLRLFKDSVRGGISSLETKYNQDLNSWEVHCHFILDVKKFDVKQINEIWSEYTKISGTNWHGEFREHNDPIVDIRNSKNLANYISKPDTWCPPPAYSIENISKESLDILDEIYRSLKGKKILIAFGNGRLKKLKNKNNESKGGAK